MILPCISSGHLEFTDYLTSVFWLGKQRVPLLDRELVFRLFQRIGVVVLIRLDLLKARLGLARPLHQKGNDAPLQQVTLAARQEDPFG